MKTFLLIPFLILTSCFNSDKKTPPESQSIVELSPVELYAEKCFKATNGFPKIIESFGYDPKNMTDEQKLFMETYDRAYCNCEAKRMQAAGKIEEEIVNLPQDKFGKFLSGLQQTDQGKGNFQICDKEAIEKSKPYYVKP